MATRILLCVEPDAQDSDLIRLALSPYGFDVTNLTNGDQAIEWGRSNPPALIIVCVEPKKVGYAICNKIKRSAELKDVPLILTSSEETPQAFAQHKKLKSRADEYMVKPLKKEDLLQKVDQLITLGEPETGVPNEAGDEILMTGDSDEIAIVDGDIVEEKGGTPPPAPMTPQPAVKAKAASPMFKGPDIDEIFDQETEAAFEAIKTRGDVQVLPPGPDEGELQDEEYGRRGAAPSPGMTRSISDFAMPVPTRAGDQLLQPDWDADATSGSMDLPLPEPRKTTPMNATPTSETPAFQEPVPSPDDVMQSLGIGDSVPISLGAANDAVVKELQAKVNELESAKSRLSNEIEELKGRMQSQPAGREKDVLQLREVINRKDKDMLDLRDQLDAKERQILDHKDRVREHERARRDLEEKTLGFEKSLVGANERVTALAHDKEKSIEREKGLKARLDDALGEIQKAYDETDSLKKKLQSVEDRARGELDRVRGELEERLKETEETHRREFARLTEDRTTADAARDKEHKEEMVRRESALASEIEALQKRATEDLSAAMEAHGDELARVRREHEKALVQVRDELSAQLAAERGAQKESVDAKEKDHKNELMALRRRLEEELAAAEVKRQKELGDAEERREADMEAAETRRRTELQAREEENHAAVAEADRRHFAEKTETAERHRGEIDQAHARAARAEGELAMRNEELAESQRKLATREAELDGARADVRDRDMKVTQARDRLTQLEGKMTELEEQILRAYQKLRTDEKTVDKAKRALAVALTLLDGQQTGQTSTGATTPRSSSSEESPT